MGWGARCLGRLVRGSRDAAAVRPTFTVKSRLSLPALPAVLHGLPVLILVAGLAANSRAGEGLGLPDQEEVGSEEIEERVSEPAAGSKEEVPPVPSKSLETAYLLAVGGTSLPLALGFVIYNKSGRGFALATGDILALGGLLAGPSLGQFYAGSPWHGLGGVLVRTVAAGLVTVGMNSFLDMIGCGMVQDVAGPSSTCEEAGRYSYLIPLGAAVYVGGLAYSAADTRRAVLRAPHRHRRHDLSWRPTLKLDGRGGLQSGALAVLRY